MVVHFHQAQVFRVPDHGRGNKGIRISQIGPTLAAGYRLRIAWPAGFKGKPDAGQQSLDLRLNCVCEGTVASRVVACRRRSPS